MFTGVELAGDGDRAAGQRSATNAQDGAPSAAQEISFEYRLMTKQQMAAYFGITERTLEVWMQHGYVPYIKIGQTVRFRLAMVLRYVDDRYLVPARDARHRRGK